ncbi:transglutaminaseTgpA domain-containing protein [Ramlibacter sp.]|uniref:transglutaminase family protein n=1 Tax=Ramlibacter sp. TaxID=1917967 RepID=UPI003D0F11E9
MLNALRQRAASLPREARDTLFLLVVIGWVMLPHAANLPWWCGLLAASVLAWRGTLAVRGQPLPGKWWLLGLLAFAVAATFLTHRTLLGRDAGVTLIVILLALKTLELRARRDAFVVFFLGFFTMLTNFFFSQSLALAAAMLIGLLGLLTALVNAHLPVGRPPLSEAAKTAAWMALLGAPVMAVLFVLFPRFAPLWGIPGDAMTGRSGLSANMQIGTVAKLALDESVAMRARFFDAVPLQNDLYWRGPVLSNFDGREWRPLTPRYAQRSLTWFNPQLRVQGPPLRYEVTLEPHNRPWLLVLDAATQPPRAEGLESIITGELQWLSLKLVTDLLRYRAESYPDFRHGPSTIAGVLPEYLELPAGLNPRTLQLAADIRREAGPGADRAALVRAAMQRLASGGYSYTLEPGVYGQHTADEFWFDKKEGFCEHIASAFAVLTRAMNIPTRIVTGYQGGERNPVDGYWTIRQSDAHAWTEVWLGPQGWVRVDPTEAVAPLRVGALQRLQAPRGVIASTIATVDPNLAANLRAAWEALNNSWNQWILNYTQSKQLDLLKNLGFESPSWEDLSYVLLAIIVGVALLGAGWSWWDKAQHDPWLRLLGAARRRLGKAGLEVPATAPPRQIATLVTDRFGESGRALAEWLLMLEAQRYSRAPSANLAALRHRFNQLVWPQ